jgi:hypothetical protein
VLLGQGDGTYGDPAYHAAGDSASAVCIGLVDGDAIPDLVVANADADNVAVLLGLGGGDFAPGVTFAVGDRPLGVGIADLDGDQVLDLVSANARRLPADCPHGAGAACCARSRCSHRPHHALPRVRLATHPRLG